MAPDLCDSSYAARHSDPLIPSPTHLHQRSTTPCWPCKCAARRPTRCARRAATAHPACLVPPPTPRRTAFVCSDSAWRAAHWPSQSLGRRLDRFNSPYPSLHLVSRAAIQKKLESVDLALDRRHPSKPSNHRSHSS